MVRIANMNSACDVCKNQTLNAERSVTRCDSGDHDWCWIRIWKRILVHSRHDSVCISCTGWLCLTKLLWYQVMLSQNWMFYAMFLTLIHGLGASRLVQITRKFMYVNWICIIYFTFPQIGQIRCRGGQHLQLQNWIIPLIMMFCYEITWSMPL